MIYLHSLLHMAALMACNLVVFLRESTQMKEPQVLSRVDDVK